MAEGSDQSWLKQAPELVGYVVSSSQLHFLFMASPSAPGQEQKLAIQTLAMDIASLPIEAVTVFLDKAEVKRSIKKDLQPGEYAVVLNKLSKSIEQKSMRIEGRGNATLGDVQFGKGEQEAPTPETLKLKQLRADRSQRNELQELLNKKRSTLNGIAEKIGGMRQSDHPVNSAPINLADLDKLGNFFTYFDQHMMEWYIETERVMEELRALDKEIRQAEEQLQNLPDHDRESQSVTVKLDVKEAGEVVIHVSYVVRDATWEPSYDICVDTANRKPKLFYFGSVKQSTGETWSEDAKLFMSTVNPNVDGQIPKLGILQVDNGQRDHPIRHERMQFLSVQCSAPLPRMRTESAKVEQAALSAVFQAARPIMIKPNYAVHKVVIGEIDLVPTKLEYVTVPSKKALAYLVANVKNTSEYPLLAAPCSIFWDKTFMCESQLEAVSPGEEFTCSLGVDTAVLVEYKAPKIFNEETGILSKTVVQTREQKIRIKNTRSDTITIKVVDRYPISKDEKIKVELLLPKPAHGIRVDNGTGRVEWRMSLKAGQEWTVLMKYKTESPKEMRLDYNEVNE